MKIKSLGFILLILTIGIYLGGCGCFYAAQKGEEAPPKPPEAKVVPPEAKKEVPVAPAEVPAAALMDINFDFDKYAIRPGDAEKLKGNYDWLKANPNKKVRVEGHCDERGTVEYNLVLGQKRADAAKNYLVNLGVNSDMLETVSYGKERPIDPGHNETAWAKNRRAHFLPLQ